MLDALAQSAAVLITLDLAVAIFPSDGCFSKPFMVKELLAAVSNAPVLNGNSM